MMSRRLPVKMETDTLVVYLARTPCQSTQIRLKCDQSCQCPGLLADRKRTYPVSLPQLRVKPWTPLHPAGTTYLTNCSVIDPASGKLLKGYHTVKIVDDTIDLVAPKGTIQIETQARTVDLEGRFLCPGLIDCHVHCTAVPGASVSQ